MTDPPSAAFADAAVAVARVQATFERVQRERMAGLPLLNEALRVELIGLRRWRGLWLGVLITPWFINLLLLPGDGQADDEEVAARWPAVRPGEYAQFAFPAGVLGFLAGREGELGEYLSCSLFSPVFEFADHDIARQTAEAGGRPAAEPPAVEPVQVGKRDFLRGRWQPAVSPPADP